ncbi:MAG TPA: sigma 54-interacting transcriptional regulator [Gemmatimonadaceae bacterium]|nr:sigma 54-interacting transcriptional regulator [Gemmatimonadaceae bacterium]
MPNVRGRMSGMWSADGCSSSAASITVTCGELARWMTCVGRDQGRRPRPNITTGCSTSPCRSSRKREPREWTSKPRRRLPWLSRGQGEGIGAARRQTEGCWVSVTASGLNPLIEEWGTLRALHPNVLVVGAEAICADLLDALRPNCRQPIETCEAGSFLALRPPSEPGTLILRDVGNLTHKGQRRLMKWLDGNPGNRIQVIATDASALWPRVRDGSFAEALYYRLNVIYIDLTD